jgi:hypothetical protein
MNNKIKILSVGIMIVTLLAIAGQFLFKEKRNSVSVEQQEISNQKTYEQGLWDGFNRTLEYLNYKGYLIKDTMSVEITEVDSVLHSR